MYKLSKRNSIWMSAVFLFLSTGFTACGGNGNDGVCGDGTVDENEQCDDGCDAVCQNENIGNV